MSLASPVYVPVFPDALMNGYPSCSAQARPLGEKADACGACGRDEDVRLPWIMIRYEPYSPLNGPSSPISGAALVLSRPSPRDHQSIPTLTSAVVHRRVFERTPLMDKDTLFDFTFTSHGTNNENWLGEQHLNGVVDGDAVFCSSRPRAQGYYPD